MKKHYLTHFFDPSTIAIIGAGERNDSVDVKLFERLREEFRGKTWLVNPGTVAGLGAPASTWILGDLDSLQFAIRAVPEA